MNRVRHKIHRATTASTATMDMRNIPAVVYLLRVTDRAGRNMGGR